MAAHATPRSASTTHRLLRPTGLVLLIVGLVGVGIWAAAAFGASYDATIDKDSTVSDVAYVIDWIPKAGVEDSVDDSDYLVVAKDQDDKVIWEGPQDELIALWGRSGVGASG